MDELDIKLLAERDITEAITAARLGGFTRLARQLSKPKRIKPRNAFLPLGKARMSLRDAARAAGIPYPTVQAAAAGRGTGALNRDERRRLHAWLLERRRWLDEALTQCAELS